MASHSGVVPFLISLLSYIILVPFVLLICLINEIVRLVVSVYLKLKDNGEVWLVSDGSDAIWSTIRSGRSRMVVACTRYKGKVNPETFIRIYNENIRTALDSQCNLAYSKLEYILVQKSGYACWKQDRNFDCRNHVRIIDRVHSKEDFKEFLKELSLDMESSRPQWECVIVPRYQEPGEMEESGWMITRFNHAYMDGISVKMITKRFLTTNFTYYLDPINFKIPKWKKILFYANATIYGPYTVLTFLKDKYDEYWPCLPSSEVGVIERNYTWARDVSLDNIRTIRNATDKTTIQSVVQNAFISAAIQVLPSRRIPDKWVIGELAALLPYPEYKPQNRFTGFMYSINSLEDDFTRLRNSKKAAWEGITGPFIPVIYTVFSLIGRMPLCMHGLLLRGANATVFFSNVPASKTKIYGVDGADVLEMLGFPPQPNDTGITLLCSTYQNAVKIAASAMSNWLKKEELEAIMEKVPNIIEEWTMEAEKIILKSKESS